MLPRTRIAALLVSMLALSSCLPEVTQPVGTPLDCATLATSLSTTTDLVTTASGLRYRDVIVGSGVQVGAGNGVGIYYSGCLTTGVTFDQRLDNVFPFDFVLGTTPLTVIAGFDEGIRGMRVGGRRQIVIPPALGYGNNPPASSGIPANATLVFTVDLVGVR
ncbi:MAG: peptidylprolyl isomerase [Gemmatimonadetes bacterium]|jgi:FKBP-type peptidyl-prolyl cis-trans isomerase|nr:peptidylprolyl isomerase [Gemmatimonadota bacterium]